MSSADSEQLTAAIWSQGGHLDHQAEQIASLQWGLTEMVVLITQVKLNHLIEAAATQRQPCHQPRHQTDALPCLKSSPVSPGIAELLSSTVRCTLNYYLQLSPLTEAK